MCVCVCVTVCVCVMSVCVPVHLRGGISIIFCKRVAGAIDIKLENSKKKCAVCHYKLSLKCNCTLDTLIR